MKSFKFKLMTVALSLTMILSFFAGCGKDKVDEDREAADAYVNIVSFIGTEGVKLSDSEKLYDSILAYCRLSDRAKLFDDVIDAHMAENGLLLSLFALAKNGKDAIYSNYVSLVETVGDVSVNSGVALDNARFYYDDLSGAQRLEPGVLASKKIYDAKKTAFDELILTLDVSAIAEVFKKYVAALPVTVIYRENDTNKTKEKLDSAADFYNGLTDLQKRDPQVSSINIELSGKIKSYEDSKKAFNDNAAAQVFISFVDRIEDEFGSGSYGDLMKAQSDYGKLTTDVKFLVQTSFNKLIQMINDYSKYFGGSGDTDISRFVELVDELEEQFDALGDDIAEMLAFMSKISEAYAEYNKLDSDEQGLVSREYERIEAVEAAYKAKPSGIIAEPRVVYTEYITAATDMFSANVFAVLSVKNAFGEPVENGIPEGTAVKVGDEVITPEGGEYIYEFDAVVRRPVYDGAVHTPEITFTINGLAVEPLSVTVLPPRPAVVKVQLGNASVQKANDKGGNAIVNVNGVNVLSPDPAGGMSGTFDPPKGPFNGTEKYEALIYDMLDDVSSARPLARFELDGMDQPVSNADDRIRATLSQHPGAPASEGGVGGGYLSQAWRVICAKFNTQRVRQALAKAGITGTKTVKVALRMKVPEEESSYYADGFIDPVNSVSQAVTLEDITAEEAGLLKFTDRLAYVIHSSGTWANKGADVAQFRVDGSLILNHSELDHIKVYVYVDDDEAPIDYFRIRVAAMGEFFATEPYQKALYIYKEEYGPVGNKGVISSGAGTVYDAWWHGMDSGCMPLVLQYMAQDKGLASGFPNSYYKGKTVRYATQLIAKPGSLTYQDGDISEFSASQTASW